MESLGRGIRRGPGRRDTPADEAHQPGLASQRPAQSLHLGGAIAAVGIPKPQGRKGDHLPAIARQPPAELGGGTCRIEIHPRAG